MSSEQFPKVAEPAEQTAANTEPKTPEPAPKKGWRQALKDALPGKKKPKPSPNIYPLF